MKKWIICTLAPETKNPKLTGMTRDKLELVHGNTHATAVEDLCVSSIHMECGGVISAISTWERKRKQRLKAPPYTHMTRKGTKHHRRRQNPNTPAANAGLF